MAKALAAYPPIAQRRANGGRNWAKRYRALPPEERARIIMKCVLGWHRWNARRNGWPDPIAFTFTPELDASGKVVAKPGSLRPMTDEEIGAL